MKEYILKSDAEKRYKELVTISEIKGKSTSAKEIALKEYVEKVTYGKNDTTVTEETKYDFRRGWEFAFDFFHGYMSATTCKDIPTHSFESLDEAKIADIVFEHAPNGATNCMKTAQAICQHFKKAEGEKC